jgi:hypothetical protein
MDINAKMIPFETLPGIGRGIMKENGGTMNSSMIYLMHFKSLCKCYNVPPPRTQI